MGREMVNVICVAASVTVVVTGDKDTGLMSSFVRVTVMEALLTWMLLDGDERDTVNVSELSGVVSSMIGMLIVFSCSPGRKVSVPLCGVKSLPAEAEPLPVV